MTTQAFYQQIDSELAKKDFDCEKARAELSAFQKELHQLREKW